jgi:hypothetical protein
MNIICRLRWLFRDIYRRIFFAPLHIAVFVFSPPLSRPPPRHLHGFSAADTEPGAARHHITVIAPIFSSSPLTISPRRELYYETDDSLFTYIRRAIALHY